jgi:hypothetical protein
MTMTEWRMNHEWTNDERVGGGGRVSLDRRWFLF